MMIIKNASYLDDGSVVADIDNVKSFFPSDPENRNYAEMLRQGILPALYREPLATTIDVKMYARELLYPTDWMVVRAAEGGISVPANVATYRGDVRAASGAIELDLGTMTITAMRADARWPV